MDTGQEEDEVGMIVASPLPRERRINILLEVRQRLLARAQSAEDAIKLLEGDANE